MSAYAARQAVRVLAWLLVAVARSCATAKTHTWE